MQIVFVAKYFETYNLARMKKYVLLLIIALAFVAACSEKSSHEDDVEYVIMVDSIACADTVKAGEKFEVAFFGFIGPDGCHHFERFHVEEDSLSATMTLIGSKAIGQNIVCTQAVQLLDGMTYEIATPDSGAFVLSIINPGLNNQLKKTIKVIIP